MKIAICDDNNAELLNVCQIVDEFIANNSSQQSITYFTFQNGIELLAAISKGRKFDILLLDVVMPLVNGIDLAAEIRLTNNVSKIIFLTSATEYAVESYKVNAYYYLLKPIKKEALLPLLAKAIADIANEDEKHIIVKFGASMTNVALSKLQYIDVVGRTISFHMQNGEVLVSFGALATFENILLANPQFIKPHRSYIVNIDYIKNITPDGITTILGAFIPVSRNIYKQVKQSYINYFFDGGCI